MFEIESLHSLPAPRRRFARLSGAEQGHGPLQARVKRECTDLYPAVDPERWYNVLMEGGFKDDLEGFWIQVEDWVTYVLARHFDLQDRPELH